MTVSEALARGIPAIVGRDTGAEEALAAGGNTPGAAVATDEPAELAVMLRALLTEPDLRNQWRERARIARAALPHWERSARTIARACGLTQNQLGAHVLTKGEPARRRSGRRSDSIDGDSPDAGDAGTQEDRDRRDEEPVDGTIRDEP